MNEEPLNSTITTDSIQSQPVESGQKKSNKIWNKTIQGIGNTYNIGGKVIKGLLSIFFLFTIVGALLGESNTQNYQILRGTDDKNQIAVIDLSGTILETADTSNPFGEASVITPDKLQATFESMKNNQNLKAIILRINSPGGSVTASDEIYQLIKYYKQTLNLPIWAVYSEVAASGGYYISLAADKIYSPETTLTGSIGVILQTINFNQLAQNYGVQSVTIKSGENKNLLDPFEPVKESQLILLQETVDEAYELFLSRVKESRNNQEIWLPLADGRILTGKQAVNAGLVDYIGGFNDAVDQMQAQIKSTDAQIIVYGKKSFIETLLMGLNNKVKISDINLNLLPENRLRGIPAYLYSL